MGRRDEDGETHLTPYQKQLAEWSNAYNAEEAFQEFAVSLPNLVGELVTHADLDRLFGYPKPRGKATQEDWNSLQFARMSCMDALRDYCMANGGYWLSTVHQDGIRVVDPSVALITMAAEANARIGRLLKKTRHRVGIAAGASGEARRLQRQQQLQLQIHLNGLLAGVRMDVDG